MFLSQTIRSYNAFSVIWLHLFVMPQLTTYFLISWTAQRKKNATREQYWCTNESLSEFNKRSAIKMTLLRLFHMWRQKSVFSMTSSNLLLFWHSTLPDVSPQFPLWSGNSRYSNGLRAGRLGFDSQQSKRVLSVPQHPHRLWGPHNLLSNRYCVLFPRVKKARASSWPLTFIQCRGQ
jgi:hypothetical protein